ncbi:MAG: LEA type 2 family protein [Acidobacteriota bacterium]|jgi:LEA14-like dessication related protein
MVNLTSSAKTVFRFNGRISRRWAGSWIGVILLVFATGCTSSTSFEPLGVTLVDLEVTEVTVFETTLAAQLRITNPNPEAISIDGGSFTLYLDEKKVGRGTTAEAFNVDRFDSTITQVVFHINNASALLRVKETFGKDEVSYGVRGSLYTQGTFGAKNLKIERTGRIDLQGEKTLETDRPDFED